MKPRCLLALLPLVCVGALSSSDGPTVVSPPGGVQVGRIIGRIEISATLSVRRPRFRIYSEAGPGSVPPSHEANTIASEMRNVVVFLEVDSAGSPAANTGSVPAELSQHVMSQANERFEPHVLPVLHGSVVRFPNRDNVYHNVFSLSSARKFDLGRYPKGESKSVMFGKNGFVQIFCRIHSDMSAIIVVMANSFFVTPDSIGRFAIENVPAGDYTVVGWHERTKPAAQRVRVVAGQSTTINLSLPQGER
jgi:plastocyanin